MEEEEDESEWATSSADSCQVQKRRPKHRQHYNLSTHLPDLYPQAAKSQTVSPFEPETRKPSKKYQFYQGFLSSMRAHPDVYNYFLATADEQHVLQRPRVKANDYFYDYMLQSSTQNFRRRQYRRAHLSYSPHGHSATPQPRLDSEDAEFDEFGGSGHHAQSFDYRGTFNSFGGQHKRRTSGMPQKRLTSDLLAQLDEQSGYEKKKTNVETASQMSGMSRASKFSMFGIRRARRRGQPVKKEDNRPRLDPESEVVKAKFAEIGGRSRWSKKLIIDAALLEVHLLKRYPQPLTERLLKNLTLRNRGDFEDYINMMNRLIQMNEERAMLLGFEALDVSDDMYVCTKDLYTLIALRSNDYCDADISLVQQMQCAKKDNRVPRRKQVGSRSQMLRSRDSTRSLVGAQSNAAPPTEAETQEQRRNKLPPCHPEKPEALTYNDYAQIEFESQRPQIYLDLILHMTGMSYWKIVNRIPKPTFTRKLSEQFVRESEDSATAYYEMQRHPDLEHYLTLQAKMNLLPRHTTDTLLSNFQILRNTEIERQAIITEHSMQDGWEQLWGYRADYLATRVFDMLSGPKKLSLDKLVYLDSMRNFLDAPKKELGQWTFQLYNSSNDGSLTANEVNDMLSCLQLGTEEHAECQKLADEFISQHLKAKTWKDTKLDIKDFGYLIPESAIVKKIKQCFLHSNKLQEVVTKRVMRPSIHNALKLSKMRKHRA